MIGPYYLERCTLRALVRRLPPSASRVSGKFQIRGKRGPQIHVSGAKHVDGQAGVVSESVAPMTPLCVLAKLLQPRLELCDFRAELGRSARARLDSRSLVPKEVQELERVCETEERMGGTEHLLRFELDGERAVRRGGRVRRVRGVDLAGRSGAVATQSASMFSEQKPEDSVEERRKEKGKGPSGQETPAGRIRIHSRRGAPERQAQLRTDKR